MALVNVLLVTLDTIVAQSPIMLATGLIPLVATSSLFLPKNKAVSPTLRNPTY